MAIYRRVDSRLVKVDKSSLTAIAAREQIIFNDVTNIWKLSLASNLSGHTYKNGGTIGYRP